MSAAIIRTGEMADRMRAKIIRPDSKEILITRLGGSAQECDITSPVNCNGLGRIRHFRRDTHGDWPENFLPIDPAARALNVTPPETMEAQVFQNAACAWRCWYCYVPFELLGGDERRSSWTTPTSLVQQFSSIRNRPSVLDLSGGSPDLTPEWVPWMIDALEEQGIADQTYLWSDDNLSTDYVFDMLDRRQLQLLRHSNYGRVCCFKGFDAESFEFNTGAAAADFDKQFERFARYVDLGIDLYAYVTFTGPSAIGIDDKVARFVDRLTGVWSALPSRTVPLRIEAFGPMMQRNEGKDFSSALAVQEDAILAWNKLVIPAMFDRLGPA